MSAHSEDPRPDAQRTPRGNTANDSIDPHPEEGATAEAVALHGNQARAETHDQPEAVTLDGSTRVATSEPED